jgi:hypothetical protein
VAAFGGLKKIQNGSRCHGNQDAKNVKFTSNFTNFCRLRWIFLQSFMKLDERNPNFFLNPPFFVSMATAVKFVQSIPILLAYLVPLDVDVVPNKFHQFLIGE